MLDKIKILLLTLSTSILLPIIGLYAQNWINEYSQWYHGLSSPLSSGYVQMEYAGDTLLNGAETGAVFKRTYYQYDWLDEMEVTTGTSLIFRESDATLYLWNEALSAFDTLIQFGAAPGDTWRTTTDYDAAGEESMSTTVIDTGHIEINAASLPWMHVEYQFDYFDMTYTEHDTIVEGIGPLEHYMLPWEAVYLSGGTGGLQCFESSNIGLYSRSGQGESCEAILTSTGESIPSEGETITVYPNPATDRAFLQVDGLQAGDEIEIMVFDTSGRLLKREALGPNREISLEGVPPGVYWLRVTKNKQAVNTLRVIVGR